MFVEPLLDQGGMEFFQAIDGAMPCHRVNASHDQPCLPCNDQLFLGGGIDSGSE